MVFAVGSSDGGRVTVELLTADPRGVPTEARCQTCGERWTRPADDPAADGLVQWARAHRCDGPDGI
jgi:hypothetical protein